MKANVVYVSDPTQNENLDPSRIVTGTPIVLNANKPEFASISLEKSIFDLSAGGREGGFMSEKHVVHFIGGPTEDLKKFVEAYGLKAGDDFNAKTGMKKDIVVKESTTLPYEGATGKINPTTNEAMLTEEGEPIYRTTLLIDKSSPDCVNTYIKGYTEAQLIERQSERAFNAVGSSSGVE